MWSPPTSRKTINPSSKDSIHVQVVSVCDKIAHTLFLGLTDPKNYLHSFLAFENTIQSGYTTYVAKLKKKIYSEKETNIIYSEKLFIALLLPVIPVYYGDPRAPNVTSSPSYIRASDFASPKALSEYLLYLDANPAEYEKYHTWRKNPNSILREYLDEAQFVPGPREIQAHSLRHDNLVWLIDRTASCCRLCNEQFLRARMAERTRGNIVNKTYNRKVDIARRFYGTSDVHFEHYT